jgi:ribose transport system substrate-binding protein
MIANLVRNSEKQPGEGEPVNLFNTGRHALGSLFVTMLFLAGCGGGPSNAPENADAKPGAAGSRATSGSSMPRLMFISNGTSDWWNAVEKGMRDGGAEFGANVEMRRPDSETAQQIQKIEDVLSLPDVQGVAISVLEADSPGIADKMRDLRRAGKIVIAIDSDGPKDTREAYIGTNNVKAGEVAGKVAKTLRPQGGKTTVFVGTAAAANARERREGFFAGAGNSFSQIEVFEDRTDHARAQTNVETAISKYPDAGVFLGLWSYNAHFIAEEVSKFPEVRKKATVVTFDMDELAVDDLAKGKIDATVCQNPYQMGYLAVRLLKAIIVHDDKTVSEMLPKGVDTIDTGVRVIVPTKASPVKGDNVIDIDEMKKWLASKGLKSS